MATKKSRKSASASKSSASKKSARKSARKSQARATQDRPASKAYAYETRIPIIADALKTDHGGSATVAELFETLHTSKDGEFATTRRVAATLRYDGRQDVPTFERSGGMVTLRKRNRVASKSKSGNVSRKKTRAAK